VRYKGSEVGVKVLLGSADGKAQAQFRQEITILEGLNHPRIIRIFGGCTVRDPTYGQQHQALVMDFAPGGSLFDLVRKSDPLTESRLALAVDIASGLAYLHSKHIVHRDLKSANIVLDAGGKAVLCDFGLAKVKESSRSKTTATAQGSPLWMAPELFEIGGTAYGTASDVYALSMVLVELVSGKYPFQEVLGSGKQNPWTLIPPLLRIGTRPQATELALIEPGLRALIEAAWAQESACRPSAATMLQQLQGLLTNGGQYLASSRSDRWARFKP
jgi:serine/threonine protein kinase